MSEKHGHCPTRNPSPTYVSWQEMKGRCLNKKRDSYPHYGGRGIKVYAPWIKSFSKFLEDMGERPEGKELDRIDTNGNYVPWNCQWSTKKQQNRNTRRTLFISIKGQKKSLAEWCEVLGTSYHSVRARIGRYGWDPKEALLSPVLLSMRLRQFCPSGHEYNEANTRTKDGRRKCRACDRKRQADRRARLTP
jgi:hypothetical protein